MKDPEPFKLRDKFSMSALGAGSIADTPSMAIRRPPVPERKQSDFGPSHMAGYLEGLERRLFRHLERHSPLWHRKETTKILNKWNSFSNNHPAPQGAVPRNLTQEAAEYAAHSVEDRIARRFRIIESVQIRYGLYDDSISGTMRRSQRRADLRDKMRYR